MGTLKGFVTTAAGVAVPDTAILLIAGPGAVSDIAPLTNEDGYFVLNDLPAGEYIVQALSPAGLSAEVSTFVSASSTREIVFTLSD